MTNTGKWGFASGHRVFLALFAALALVPVVAQGVGEPFYITLGARILVYALAALALNLILDFAGLISFGHAMFMGLGCYAVGIMSFYGVDNGWLQLLLCVTLCMTAALLVGAICLRTSGTAFIMITLAFAQMFYFLAVSLRQYGGDDGLNIYGASDFGLFALNGSYAVYWAAWGVLLTACLLMLRLRSSPLGMMLRATASNPRRVNALGWSVFAVHLTAYVASGALAGIAGLLLANLTAFASPSYMAWTVSGELILIVVVGGLGNVLGPVFGAVVYLLLQEGFKSLTIHWLLLMGPTVLAVAMMAKNGYGVSGMALLRWLGIRRQADVADVVNASVATESATPPTPATPAKNTPPAPANDTGDAVMTQSMPMALVMENLSRSFGGLKAVDDVSLEVPAGQLHALIGPNGAGKTTLINLLSGELRADGGTVHVGNSDVSHARVQQRVERGMLRSYQVTSVFDDYTALDNVCLAALRRRRRYLSPWVALMHCKDVVAQAHHCLRACRLEEVMDVPVGNMAYGQRRQLEIAMALAGEPSVLLLDEPMAGMSASESANVVALLQSLKGHYTIVLVEHDMNAVFALADRISVLVYGKVIASGSADDIRNHSEVRRAYLGDDADA